MRIEPERRARYLAALGIERWVRRQAAPAVDPSASPGGAPSASPGVAPRASLDPSAVATDWPGLQAQVERCRRCALHAGRQQTVFGQGDREAAWMVVGEAPGSEEDKCGEPFVGAAGQLLTAMLAAIHLPREQVFIANILKCRPPDNRDPKPAEMAECLPYLQRQIELVQPKIILAFGRIAAQQLLGVDLPLARLRGRLHRLPGLELPVVVTYHPAYLLRAPTEKRKAWEDLKFARRSFQELAG